MSTESADLFYDEAWLGGRLYRAVPRAALKPGWPYWSVGSDAPIIPFEVPRPAPRMQQVVRNLREWTGWSSRRLADVVRTTHTTVLGLESGRALMDSRSGDLRQRLSDASDVIGRVYLLAGSDPGTVAIVLDTAPPGRRSATNELRAGAPAAAYLAALDVLRPRATGLLVGDRPKLGDATTPLHD